MSAPRIGVDDWVEQVEGRRGPGGPLEPLRRAWDGIDPVWRWAVFFAIAAAFPFMTDSSFLIRVAVNVLLFAMLALGLNITVGWAGLLDLGYVAFYGFGAYGYALVSSGQFDLHWPTIPTIVAVTLATALLGLLLGLPSWRLSGDYLAIVTLFFLQIFIELTINLDRIEVPWSDSTINLTGGPNGIPGVDRMSFFGLELTDIQDYFYLLLVLLMLAVTALSFLNESRIGRAWRAIREDPLAAEMMTVPVNRLKLMAFALGAGMAGLTGTVFAAVQIGVFPANFEVTLLIMIYAALILGGAGTIAGPVLGAIIVASIPEILRTPDSARWLFYTALAVAIVALVRPWWKTIAFVAATIAFGFAVHAIVGAVWEQGTTGTPAEGGVIANGISSWVVMPGEHRTTIGNYAFVALIAAVLALVRLRGWARLVLAVPTVYLAVFVWENRLVFQPSITRQLLFGAILIVLMVVRPHGLLGKPRVEVV
jgi:branched-chain amino acid transport system permease protein